MVHASEAVTAQPLFPPSAQPAARATFARIAREEVEARLAAEGIEQEARARADRILSEAREQSVAAAEHAGQEAREKAQASVVAEWVAVRLAEDARLRGDQARVIMLAVALAERLVGAALEIDPSRIVGLAEGVLSEVRGARRATVEAHPVDGAILRQHVATLGLEVGAVDVRDDPALARGALRLHTDIGILDARLAPRLERLAVALADMLSDAHA